MGRHATRELTRIGLVLTPRRGRRGAWVVGIVGAAVLAAAATSWWHRLQPVDGTALTGALHDNTKLQQQLEQTRLHLGMAEAHAQELERQIDTLNRRLRETQEELAFFRKSRDAKH